MKKMIFLLAITFSAVGVKSQALITEKCKVSEVEIQELSPEWDKNTVVVSFSTVLFDRKVSSLSELSEKEIRKMKKWARKRNSCHIYVDFEQSTINKELNPTITENHLSYLVVLNKEG